MTKIEQAIWTYISSNADSPHSYATLAKAVGTQEQHAGQRVRKLVKSGHLEIIQQLRTGTVYRVVPSERADFLGRAEEGSVSPSECVGQELAEELGRQGGHRR